MKIHLIVVVLVVLASCFTFQVIGQDLSAQLMRKDSILFNAVLKSCNLNQVHSVFAPEFVFEQDGGEGNSVSSIDLTEFMNRIKSRCERGEVNIRRVTREVTASLQGHNRAIQKGIQQFYLITPQGQQLVETSRFSRSWRKQGADWKMTYELNYPAVIPEPSAVTAFQATSSQSQSSLYKLVAELDEKLFTAFDKRQLNEFMAFFSKDLEFYHDRGGLTNYEQNVAIFKKNFADSKHKMRRELVAGTMEVYPIGEFGALQLGIHRFYSIENGKEQLVATARFAQIWKNENGKWLVTREISYDHR